jgi:enoyl-CoA hydratase
MNISNFSWCTVSVADTIATVELTPTGKISRMGPDFWREMPVLFAELDAASEIRAIIIHGGGTGFSSGLDLTQMGAQLLPLIASETNAKVRTELHQLITNMQKACSSVAACRKPVIAAIHGFCIGGAIDLISACDVRFCSSEAVFSIREVKLAIVADMGTLARLPTLIGQGATRELALSGEDFDAARAHRLGLVSHVLPSSVELLAHARAYAAKVAANPPLVVQGIKQVLNAQSEQAALQANQYVALWNAAFMPSDDIAESLTAFMEKRPPHYQGK